MPVQPRSNVGMPRGEHGCATPANSAAQRQDGQPDHERMKISYPALQGHWISSTVEADRTKLAIADLSHPPRSEWIARRVVTLLSHYFDSEKNPDAIAEMAKDWVSELSEFPEWSIQAAARWWLSRHNKFHYRAPYPGDISDRADTEMAIVRTAKSKIKLFERYGDNPPAFLK